MLSSFYIKIYLNDHSHFISAPNPVNTFNITHDSGCKRNINIFSLHQGPVQQASSAQTCIAHSPAQMRYTCL